MKKKSILFVIFVLLYLFLLLLRVDTSWTQDLGRHIKLGEIIVSCHCVPQTNLFSYVETSHSFINHHWFSEVLFYILYSISGINLVLIFKIIVFIISFGIVYTLSIKRSNTLWATVVAIPSIYLLSERFDARPEILSFLFLSIFLYLIYTYKKNGFSNRLWMLPLIELIWVNSHIYFIVGVLLAGILVVDETFSKKKKFDRRILIIFALTSLVTLLNPNGISGALLPLTVLNHYGYSIVENQSPLFLNKALPNIRILYLEAVALFLILSTLFTIKKQSVFSLLSSIVVTILAFTQIRNIPLFVLTILPVLSFNFFTLEKEFLARAERSMQNIIKTLVLSVIVLFASITLFQSVTAPSFGFWAIDIGDKGVEFLQKNNIRGPIFNNFNIGSYLIFRLYPHEQIFVDGRPEAYSVEFFDRYKKMQTDPEFFKAQSKKYHLNTVFFTHSDITPWAQSFLKIIVKNPDWTVVYLDDYVIIAVRNVAENKAVIQKYGKTIQIQ